MNTIRKIPIAVAKGDGIGPEIMDACLKIFDAAKVPFDYKFIEMGKDLYLKGHSTGMTDQAKETVESTRILFKGPMETPKGSGVKSINVTARKVWSTFANKRVFQTLPGVETVFSKQQIPIDLTIFRENIEDTYGGIEHFQTRDVSQCRRLITRPGCEQIHKSAFEAAILKNASRVTCGHKANIMKLTDGMFLETFYKVAANYPQIKADDTIVDDLCMKLVMKPDSFEIIVLPNLQGDIVSDLCAGLIGGLGMAPSANLGDEICIFEAVHGTAPDIVGKSLANPTALLLSGTMMLRHFGLTKHASAIEGALRQALKHGIRTADLSQRVGFSPVSTNDFVKGIISYLPTTSIDPSTSKQWLKILNAPRRKLETSNLMMKSPPVNLQKTVGVDIFVDSDLSPGELSQQLISFQDKGLKLVMISNRGTQVWPTSSAFTQCVNHYRCRFEKKDGVADADIFDLVKKISGKIRVCSLEMLLEIDGKKMFTLAQGQ